MVRQGQKVSFEVERTFGTLKPNHKYTGYFIGQGYVKYGTYTVKALKITPILTQPKKVRSFTSAEYKLFSDQCFEVAVRYRDKWTSVISGKKFLEYDWNGLNGGHYIGRGNWPTRHLPMNCHAITKNENRAMAQGDASVWEAYRTFLIKTYGQQMYDEMMALQKTYVRLTMPLLKADSIFCFDFLVQQVGSVARAKSIMTKRFAKFPKEKQYRQLLLLDETITQKDEQ